MKPLAPGGLAFIGPLGVLASSPLIFDHIDLLPPFVVWKDHPEDLSRSCKVSKKFLCLCQCVANSRRRLDARTPCGFNSWSIAPITGDGHGRLTLGRGVTRICGVLHQGVSPPMPTKVNWLWNPLNTWKHSEGLEHQWSEDFWIFFEMSSAPRRRSVQDPA